MHWASIDEFSNKLTMYKWARAVDRENPTWAFSYGYQPLDAGLTIGAAVSSGVVPFEAQTPEMTLSVNTAFRERWFSFIQEHDQALLDTPHAAQTGIWYSSATRDYQDGPIGMYGMYVTTTPPTIDPDWWSDDPDDSALTKPHLGGYRGAAHAMIKLHVPFKVIADPGDPAGELANIKFLWLPSVTAISDAAAETIKNFVANGGVLLATGETPGTMDEWGNIRSENIFQELFNSPLTTTGEQSNTHGNGIVIYNPELRGADLFASVGDPNKANQGLNIVEQLVRTHVQDDLIVTAPDGVHVEVGRASETEHYLYVLNYSGLQQPLAASPQNIGIEYRTPAGYRITGASAETPDVNGQSGSLPLQQTAEQYYGLEVHVDQFTLIKLTLEPTNVTPTAAFVFSCTDLSCGFTDQSVDSDGTVTAWSWNFGDGGSSAERNPNHTYTSTGTSTVALTVTDDSGLTHSVSQDVTVTGAIKRAVIHPILFILFQ
ncbi:MAG: PKD domain-containing protein [Candidatus Electrothrix sp. AR4]|nr:PKD domain-containing protein [Candidatus Electrothrix sp. AR4]